MEAQIQAWLDKNPIDLFDDCQDGLSKEDIDNILDGKSDQVMECLFEYNLEYIWQCEKSAIEWAIDDLGLEIEDPSGLEVYPVINVNLDKLAANTTGYIGVDLGFDHDTYAQDYDDVKIELEDLGFNPFDYRDEWPNLPKRDPLISPRSLEELWINCFYSGNYTALLECSTVLELALAGKLEGNLVLKKGAPVTIYDFLNGSGSMIVPTLKDITVKADDIYNDGSLRYGIQSCYGMCSSEWSGELETLPESEV